MKKIQPKSLGKHIGHAVEGHCRGLLKRLCFQSRLRQGLSLLSVFSNEEIEAWLKNAESLNVHSSSQLQNFVHKAFGNKTKEIYDRISEARRSATTNKKNLLVIGVLDGDFSQDTLAEMSGEYGYDLIYSLDELIAEIEART